MTWFKVDDGFYDHPKVAELSMAARGLWVTCGSYCGRHLTDGHITRRQVRRLGGTAAQIRDLVTNRMWIVCESHDDCLAFHDWKEQQPSRDQVETRRADDAERKRKAREAKRSDQQKPGNVRTDVRTDSAQTSARSPGNAESALPDPTRPDPTPYRDSALGGTDPNARAGIPPRRCSKHINDPMPPPCGACADARRNNEQWTHHHTSQQTAATATARALIRDCPDCDDFGWLHDLEPVQRCEHRGIA